MTKIKLVDGAIINAETVEIVNGVLEISTKDHTAEELAEIFSEKGKTNLITLMTESEIESGYQKGFTSFAGIRYGADGMKTVQLFQPADVTEARISNAEGTANAANFMAESANEVAKEASQKAEEANTTAEFANKVASDVNVNNSELAAEVTDTQLAVAELAELLAGGAK